jgi:hypothetical protein
MPSNAAVTGAVAATLANRRTLNPARRRAPAAQEKPGRAAVGAPRAQPMTPPPTASAPPLPPMLQSAVAAGRLTPEQAVARGMANRPAFAARMGQDGPPVTMGPKPPIEGAGAPMPAPGEKPMPPPGDIGQIERMPGPPLSASGPGMPNFGPNGRGEVPGGGFSPGGLPLGGPNPPQFGGLPEGMTRGIPPELMQRIQALRGGGMSPMGGPVGMNGGGLQAGPPPQMGGAAGPGGIVGPGAVAQPTPQPPAYNPWGSGGGGGSPMGLDAFYRTAR